VTTMAQSTPSAKTALDRSLVAVEVLVGLAVVAAIIGKTYGAAPTIVFLLAGGAVAFTLYSVTRMLTALRDPSLDVTGKQEDETRAALEHEKLLLLQGIKELEADAAVGKVDPEDYRVLRAKSEGDALAIIQRIKAEDERWLREARGLVERRLGASAAAGAPPVRAEDAPPPEAASSDPRYDHRPVRFEVSPSGALTCAGCQTENTDDGRFCIGCGRPRAVEAQA
jgi:hypothetical protein